MYQKVLHSQLFTHKSLGQKKKTMKEKWSLKQIQKKIPFFFPPVELASYIYSSYSLSLQLYLQNLRLKLVKFCVWKNSLCICIFSSIFTSMHVDLAIACVWPEQNTPQYILVHDKHIQIHVVDFKNKNSKGWLQIQQTSNSWIRIEENPNCWIQSNKPKYLNSKSEKTPKSLISIQQT